MWLFAGNVRLEIVRLMLAGMRFPHIHLPRLTRPSLCPPIRPPVRACVYILCVFLPPLFSFKKSCSATCLSISHLWKSFDISDKKALYIWCVFPNPLLLHPLSRTGAAIVWHSDRNGVGTLPFFLLFGAVCFMSGAFKKENEKKLQIYLEYMK